MNFNMKTPCSTCPFRSDVNFHLDADRVEEILDSITNRDQTFLCHKTINSEPSKKEHCAGALVMLEKEDNPNQMMRISERLGMYDRSKLNMKAPVFDSFEDMQCSFDELG